MPRAHVGKLRIGPFEVDQVAHELSRSGIRVPLQEKQFQLLSVFLQSPNEVVTREELRKALWPSERYGEFDIGLNQAVRRLRRALGDSARNPQWIETLPRIGYRFIGPVSFPAPTETQTPATDLPAPKVSRRLLAWMVGLVVIVAAIWGYAALSESSTNEGSVFGPASLTSSLEDPCEMS